MKNLKSRLIMFVLLVGIVFSGYKIVDYFYTSYDEKQNFNNVEKLVESEYEDEKIQYNDFEILKKYKKVYEKNNDLVGWIKIKNTNIDYPVMQTKDDYSYYLKRNFNKKSSIYGTPFVGEGCGINPNSDNVIIYGHNINGRRYFGYLQNFREETFFKEHPKFSFTAVGEKEKEYGVVSVLETDKYAEYYSFTDYGNEEDYCRMVEKILSHSKFQSEAAKKMKNEIEESSAEAFFRNYQFVTLSTCRTMDGKDKRLMVIGCRKR